MSKNLTASFSCFVLILLSINCIKQLVSLADMSLQVIVTLIKSNLYLPSLQFEIYPSICWMKGVNTRLINEIISQY